MTLPAGSAASTTYHVKTTPGANTLTLSATQGGSTLDFTNTGSGTHTLTSVAEVIVNDTELNLGSVNSFVEYNDDLYMGRNTFAFTATTDNAGDTITMSAADVAKIIVSDNFVGTGIAPDAVVESIDFGTNIVTMDKENTASGSNVSVTVNASPARIIDGILTKIYRIDIPKPVPLDLVKVIKSSLLTLSFKDLVLAKSKSKSGRAPALSYSPSLKLPVRVLTLV